MNEYLNKEDKYDWNNIIDSGSLQRPLGIGRADNLQKFRSGMQLCFHYKFYSCTHRPRVSVAYCFYLLCLCFRVLNHFCAGIFFFFICIFSVCFFFFFVFRFVLFLFYNGLVNSKFSYFTYVCFDVFFIPWECCIVCAVECWRESCIKQVIAMPAEIAARRNKCARSR